MQVLLMNAPKATQIGPERCASALAGIAVDLAAAISIIVPRPLVHPMTNRGMSGMAPAIALPLVGIELRAVSGNVLRHQGRAGTPIGMVPNPEALLARIPRDETDNRRTIVGVGPMPSPLIGPPTGRIIGVRMRRAFFPPRFGTARPPQMPCPT
jgi:hypothetical protein